MWAGSWGRESVASHWPRRTPLSSGPRAQDRRQDEGEDAAGEEDAATLPTAPPKWPTAGPPPPRLRSMDPSTATSSRRRPTEDEEEAEREEGQLTLIRAASSAETTPTGPGTAPTNLVIILWIFFFVCNIFMENSTVIYVPVYNMYLFSELVGLILRKNICVITEILNKLFIPRV